MKRHTFLIILCIVSEWYFFELYLSLTAATNRSQIDAVGHTAMPDQVSMTFAPLGKRKGSSGLRDGHDGRAAGWWVRKISSKPAMRKQLNGFHTVRVLSQSRRDQAVQSWKS